jgi:hypothetical protein
MKRNTKRTTEVVAKKQKPTPITGSDVMNFDNVLEQILSYFENDDLFGLAKVSKRFYQFSRRIHTDPIFYSTTDHGPPRIRPKNGPSLVFIKSGKWFFLKSIDDQAHGPFAIASQSQFGTYQFASLSSGGTNQALTTLDTNTTVGVVKINGFFLGLFLTRAFHDVFEIKKASEYDHPWKREPVYPKVEDDTKKKQKPEEVIHNHMEDHFLEAMYLLLTDRGLREILEALLARSSDGNTLVITLKGTKSPCFKCAYNLINFVTKVNGMVVGTRKIRVLLRCKSIGIYEGELLQFQITAFRALVKNGIPLIPWGIVERGGKFYTKRGLLHEFASWQEDWKEGKFKEHFELQQQSKKNKFFNLDKKIPFDVRYVDLRRLLFKSLSLYREYGRKVTPVDKDDLENVIL